jgi:hypothetical protein
VGLCAALLALPSIANAQTRESGSLVVTPDGAHVLSANFDAGSVSKLDAATGALLAELPLGREIERLALGDDGRLLLASDALGGRVHLVDVERFRSVASAEVGARPFGAVYDAETRLFWVALFEAGQLVALDHGARIRQRIATRATPRGLALTADGRLLVTHALLGAVSIVDLRRDPPVEIGHVALAETQDPDPFVSQGKPRLLDDIALHPNGREAWLPHVLWSFGHAFQFRSTVFPAVSVISLERGAERELGERRKELFRQINIQDSATRTRIVSNPHDLCFAPDGRTAYVTLAGSEDLAVFDLSREATQGEPRRARRRGKRSSGGAQVVQILRHLPGDNPRGIVVRGGDLLVQNAMSLDLSRLARGDGGPFARVRVAQDVFAQPVARDPLPAPLRRGKRLFYSANTSEFPEHPPAGDFWMSCASCHVDGFNFTNRFLMADTKLDPSGTGAAGNGHRGLRTLVAGDFVGDYIRMFQDTQGGMGADDREPLPRIDPDRPSAPLRTRMEDLHAFVTAPENLPYLSTWLRLDQPERTVAEGQWTNPADCAECHPTVFRDWASSNHRLMSTSHPYYRFIEDLAAREEGEGFRQWCMGCHNPKAVSAGRASSAGPAHTRDAAGAALVAAAARGEHPLDEGTDCQFCHRVASLEHAGGNASLTVNLTGRERYPLEASPSAPLRWFGERLIQARPSVHRDSYLRDFYADSRYCGSCHSEFAPGSGAVISDTYAEWAASPFNAPGDPARHRTCADCHMHADASRLDQPVPGQATLGGPWKANLRSHRFTGASVDLLAARDPAAAEQSLAMLKSAAALEAGLESGRLRVRVRNVGAGHHLPTGVADLRELWLWVRVRDRDGGLVLESGAPAQGGALPGDARIFNKVLGDAEGQPVGLRFWRYTTLLRDTRIPAGEQRDELFELPAGARFPLKVDAELRFRTFAPAVTAQVRAVYPDVPEPQVHAIAQLSTWLEGS